MNLCTVSSVEEMYNCIDSVFNTALINKADKIVFFNHYRNQSNLKNNIFVIIYLKLDNYGNETIMSIYDNILKINNNAILLYEVINKFKEEHDDIPIDVWPDFSPACIRLLKYIIP